MVSSLCEQQRRSQEKIEEISNTVIELSKKVEDLENAARISAENSKFQSKGVRTKLPTALSVSYQC